MSIMHVGHSTIYSKSTYTSSKLKTLLCVLGLTKNLLSVSQFAQDHDVFFEFHSNFYYIKFQGTKKILLQGTVKDGLYVSRFAFNM